MKDRIPNHVAIIMDGNGRWAKRRLLPRSAGHYAGMKRIVSLSEYVFDCGVKWCTLYALSTENFNRPQEELAGLFDLFRNYFTNNVKRLKKKGIALRVIGNMKLLPDDIVRLIKRGEEETKGGERGTLVLAIAYGARQEILAAVNCAVKDGREVSEEDFSKLMYTDGIPDPDLLIRTGKEVRLSNFLLWQAAYTEFYFTGKLFPDFTNKEFDKALESYASRERRFGKIEQ